MADFVISRRNYAVGTHPVAPTPVPAGVARTEILIDRADWLNAAVTMNFRLELSLDAGATWSPDPSGQEAFPWAPFPITFSGRGGAMPMPGGGTLANSTVSFDVPQPDNPNRQVRGSMVVEGATLRTTITIRTT
jgi:hypothetical protein